VYTQSIRGEIVVATTRKKSTIRKSSRGNTKSKANIKRQRGIIFVLIFALIGIFLIIRAFAAESITLNYTSFDTNTAVNASVVAETNKSTSKRETQVVQITGAASPVSKGTFSSNTLKPGSYKACFVGISNSGLPTGQLYVKEYATKSGTVLGSLNYSSVSKTTYGEFGCVTFTHSATSNNVVAFTATNSAANTIIRVSNVVITPITITPPTTGTYYLSPAGSDSNPGTLSKPWRTFTASLPKLKAGNVLNVRGGTYTEKITLTDLPDGTATSRIVLQNYPNERPVIENQVTLGSPSYWTISGINVHWASTAAVPGGLLVRIYGGTDWIFENAEIWGSRGTAGLHVDDGPSDSIGKWTVRNNCVHDTYKTDGTNQDHLLYINTTKGGTGLIEGNILFNSLNGRGIKLGPGDTGGPTNVTVRYNSFYNNTGPSNIQLSKGTSNITIYRNLLQKSSSQNITAFELTGTGSVARDNAGWDASAVVGPAAGLSDGGGNVKINPQFDSLTCDGFHPQNAAAQAYGKYAL
jgi:hypothetical protein